MSLKIDWPGRREAEQVADQAPFRLLEPLQRIGDPTAENLLIQGDNLHALRALLPYCRGEVKCIAIDPPYNTRSAFEHYDDNLEHSKWLSMMYPRLELMRDLLAANGSIWVCIDDNEAHYLKVIMDDVFGRDNFVATIIWQKKYAVSNDHKSIAPMHDYVLVYRKSEAWQRNLLPRTEDKDRQYRFEDSRGTFRLSDYTCNKTAEERPNLYYAIRQPFTGDEVWPSRTRVWAYGREQHIKQDVDGLVYWGKDGLAKTPSFKRYKHLLKHSGIVPQTLWMHEFAGHTDESRKEVRAVLSTVSLVDDFLTPKPERLMKRILEVATNPGDLVLDSFLGSGTTAAVAHKMGRHWVGIEMGEHAVTHCLPRLEKVVEGEQGGISESVGWKGGGGFRFARLGPAVFDAHRQINPAVRFPALAAHIWMTETGAFWTARGKSPLLGIHDGTAYYLLYNGVLGEAGHPELANVLNPATYRKLPKHDGPKVIYGEACYFETARQRRENIQFKLIPRELKIR